jgi:hypothetical protein
VGQLRNGSSRASKLEITTLFFQLATATSPLSSLVVRIQKWNRTGWINKTLTLKLGYVYLRYVYLPPFPAMRDMYCF